MVVARRVPRIDGRRGRLLGARVARIRRGGNGDRAKRRRLSARLPAVPRRRRPDRVAASGELGGLAAARDRRRAGPLARRKRLRLLDDLHGRERARRPRRRGGPGMGMDPRRGRAGHVPAAALPGRPSAEPSVAMVRMDAGDRHDRGVDRHHLHAPDRSRSSPVSTTRSPCRGWRPSRSASSSSRSGSSAP